MFDLNFIVKHINLNIIVRHTREEIVMPVSCLFILLFKLVDPVISIKYEQY